MTGHQAHDPWTDRLSDYLDGDLGTRQRRRLVRHLETCAGCRAALAELRMVVSRAPALAREAPAEPDLWPGIARRLTARRRPWWQRLAAMPPWAPLRVALPVAAAAMILATGAGLAWKLMSERTAPPVQVASGPAADGTPLPAPPADTTYDDTVANLRRIVQTRLTADPTVIEVLDRNLDSIDEAIADYEDSLARRPDDERLRGRWETARQRKVEILKQAAQLAAGASE